jgi:acetyl-CoA carboxylase biotin carboxyl carrier protein
MPTTKAAGIDKKLIRELADILNETNLTEIEVEQGQLRVRVSRGGGQPAIHYAAAPAVAVHAPASAAPVPTPVAAPSADAGNKNVIPAPMVGTVYLSPAPGAQPFITVGQQVREGQTLLIIEAMKTMNQIPAPRSGTLSAILVEDAQPVEYGEALVVID